VASGQPIVLGENCDEIEQVLISVQVAGDLVGLDRLIEPTANLGDGRGPHCGLEPRWSRVGKAERNGEKTGDWYQSSHQPVGRHHGQRRDDRHTDEPQQSIRGFSFRPKYLNPVGADVLADQERESESDDVGEDKYRKSRKPGHEGSRGPLVRRSFDRGLGRSAYALIAHCPPSAYAQQTSRSWAR